MEFLALFIQRNVIITLAVIGAVIATTGSVLLKGKSQTKPEFARFMLKSGYAITWLSITLFIIAGFLGD